MNSTGTRDEAQTLANRIMDFWGRKGYVVRTTLVPMNTLVVGEAGEVEQWHGACVRSDMVNGWPREVYEARRRASLA